MGGRLHWGTMVSGREPHTYKMYFPTMGVPRDCLVKGCWGRAAMRLAMRVHILHQHLRYTVIIME